MMKKYANYGGLLGLALVLIGAIVYSVNAIMTTITAIVMIVGVVLLLAYVVLQFNEIKANLSSRSAKFGSNAALMIVFIFGILVVINIIFNRFTLRYDTTAAKQYSLAEQTRKVLKNLDQVVQVIGFFKSGEERGAKELLTEYSHYSPRFSFEFVDPDKKPGLAKKNGIKSYGTILIESEGKSEKVMKSTEEDITNALIKVTREGVKKIYFTTGHGEKEFDSNDKSGLSKMKTAIEDQGYQVAKILLTDPPDSIPADCALLIVAGPKTDFLKPEADKVEKYLERGGKALFMLDPESPAGYGDFLQKWGFKVDKDLIVDASGIGQLFGAGPTIPIVSKYEKSDITKDFGLMTFFPEARSISKAENVPSGITVTEVAKTSPRSWGETSPITNGRVGFDEGKDLKGPVPVLTVAEKTATNPIKKQDKYNLGTGQVKTRIAVFGDSDFASDGYFKNQGNGGLFLNTMNWLAEEEDLISVRPHDPEDRRLNLTQKQSKVILYLGVILLPLVIFASGIVVYKKRK